MAPHVNKREYRSRHAAASSKAVEVLEVPPQEFRRDLFVSKHDPYVRLERFKRRNTPLRADQVRQEEEKKPSKQEIEAEKRKHKKELREERARLERNEVFQTLYHKQTLTPADVIFRSIRGDPSIDSTTFVVHYMDRFLGLMAVPFEEFEEGEIPCHRIQRFTRRVDNQEEIVWDRATRVNILGQCTATLEQTV